MDPSHVTEFASDRYFEKLDRLRDSQGQNVQQPSTGSSVVAQTSSQFILPLRGSHLKEVEEVTGKQTRHERTRLFNFRSKFHTKASSTQLGEHAERRTSLGDPIAKPRQVAHRQTVTETEEKPINGCGSSRTFDDAFSCLPNELQVEIIASLPLSDILNLRLTSKSLHVLVSLNEAPIARQHMEHHIPAYAKRLYPVPEGTPLNFRHLCGIWHRLHVAAKLSYMISEWIAKDLFLRNTEEKRKAFGSQTERMRRRLIPLLFTIFHFFETYRDLCLRNVQVNGGHGRYPEPYTVNPIEAKIMSVYDDRTLLRVHEVFPLVISSFCRRLRPPTYVGRVERSLRGYLREQPPDEVHVAILCIGGLREVGKIWEIKGYNARLAKVDDFYGSISRDPPEPEPKKRRGMLGLGRKKSSVVMGKSNAAADTAVDGRRASTSASAAAARDATGNLIFNTSLAAGMPMSLPPRDQLKMLLADLPVLQRIWVDTAEVLILERGIVERPSHIKRNDAVLLDLIRDDGFDEEDQWWYGAVAPESVRPNLAAIEEDSLE